MDPSLDPKLGSLELLSLPPLSPASTSKLMYMSLKIEGSDKISDNSSFGSRLGFGQWVSGDATTIFNIDVMAATTVYIDVETIVT